MAIRCAQSMLFRTALGCALAALGAGQSPAEDKHALPPAGVAQSYTLHETHADEKVTIAADPFDTKEKVSVFRVDYLKRKLMPIRVIVTNNSEKPIHLEQARIFYISRDGDKVKASTEEQADRRMSDIKDPSRSMRLPGGLGSGLKTQDKDIHKDYDDADFRSLVVMPGATESGVLFFDVSDYDDPLKGAKLYARQITEDDGNELFYFEVPLSLSSAKDKAAAAKTGTSGKSDAAADQAPAGPASPSASH